MIDAGRLRCYKRERKNMQTESLIETITVLEVETESSCDFCAQEVSWLYRGLCDYCGEVRFIFCQVHALDLKRDIDDGHTITHGKCGMGSVITKHRFIRI